jgi:Uma2 family endonuclease
MSEATAAGKLPPLENGDRLTRSEFERRRDAMRQRQQAELIEGVVYLSDPEASSGHADQQSNLIQWMGEYCGSTPGFRGVGKSPLRLDLDNEPLPDAVLFVPPSHGGRIRVDEDGHLAGSPELIGEVTHSSVSYDLHDKRDAYRRNGVLEYVVWRVLDQAIDWFVLREGRYVPLAPGEDGLYRSEVLPGLWLDPAALIRGEMAAVMQALQQGLASPEHAEFVARLQEKASGSE